MSSQSLRSALISRPTILIIHGAWHTPLHFAPLTAYLFSYEYPAIVVSLPSTGNPDKGLDDDIATITSHLKELVEVQGREVLLVTHAYGGIPGSGAVGPFVRSQRVEGLPGGVVGILWMCSAIRSKGNGLVSDFKAGYPPWMVVTPPLVTLRDPERDFYNDLPYLDASFYASKLKPQSLASSENILESDCFATDTPSTYLITQQDQIMSVPDQEEMAARIPHCKLERCDAGHSPFLSQTELVGKLVRKCAGEEVDEVDEARKREGEEVDEVDHVRKSEGEEVDEPRKREGEKVNGVNS